MCARPYVISEWPCEKLAARSYIHNESDVLCVRVILVYWSSMYSVFNRSASLTNVDDTSTSMPLEVKLGRSIFNYTRRDHVLVLVLEYFGTT
jgi:hypothetical protein